VIRAAILVASVLFLLATPSLGGREEGVVPKEDIMVYGYCVKDMKFHSVVIPKGYLDAGNEGITWYRVKRGGKKVDG
jgi:hypothetical protein